MRLIFDTFGGDNAPYEIIKGATEAYKEFDVEIALVGDEDEIKKTLKELNFNEDVEVINATEKIENDEEPAFALRKKKNSSTVLGLKALNEGHGDAFISAGSTGALLAGGLFITGRVKNIKRAVLPTSLPGLQGQTLVIDSGANLDCDPELLAQFALMGKVYLENVQGIKNPKVGLLNVGTEEGKGNAKTKEAFNLLKEMDINFVGNIEARDVSLGDCDLVVCDGFDGNILLKNTEGVAKFLLTTIQKEIATAGLSKNTLMEIQGVFNSLNAKLNYKEFGGTILLGLKKVLVKAHGDSDSYAIRNAAKVAIDAVNKDIVNIIEEKFVEDDNEK